MKKQLKVNKVLRGMEGLNKNLYGRKLNVVKSKHTASIYNLKGACICKVKNGTIIFHKKEYNRYLNELF